MLRANLEEAVREAKKFIELVEAQVVDHYNTGRIEVRTKNSSALRRKSMELSRKLSQLRNERY